MKSFVIAIDGPAGAGKSTVAQLVAQKLQYTYIDTGAMYRAVAWKTLQQQKPVTDALVLEVVKDIQVSLQYANQVFDHLISNVGNALAVVEEAKHGLNKSTEDNE